MKNAAGGIADAILDAILDAVPDVVLDAVLTGKTEWNAVSVKNGMVSAAAKVGFPDGKSVQTVPGVSQTGFQIGIPVHGGMMNVTVAAVSDEMADVLNGTISEGRNAGQRPTGLGA